MREMFRSCHVQLSLKGEFDEVLVLVQLASNSATNASQRFNKEKRTWMFNFLVFSMQMKYTFRRR